MSRRVLLAVAVLLGLTAACSDEQDPGLQPGPVESTTASPTLAPATRTFHVTVRDEASWVWDLDDDCAFASDFGPPFFAVEGSEDGDLWEPSGDEVDLPESGILREGGCEMAFEVEVEPASRYRFGVGFEGKGIASGDEPAQIAISGGVESDEGIISRSASGDQDLTLIIR